MDAIPTPQGISGTGPPSTAAFADPNHVRSVDRAVSLLLALGVREEEVGVSEIARSLGLHKSTASRLLATLQRHGLVEQNGDSGKYRLGLALIHLGGVAEKTIDLPAIAMPELMGVARSIREVTTLGVLRSDAVMTIAWAHASGMGNSRSGTSLPLHATAPGKVLLSSRPERELVRLSKLGFTAYTPNTIVRLDLLLEEIARVRKRGFATAFGEHTPGVDAVAVPVFDQRGAVVAALEVKAVGRRITPDGVPELVEKLREAAAAITAKIGGVAPTN